MFMTTEELLRQREHLHDLVDMFWRCGTYTRSSVYAEMAQCLNMDITPHISDLGTEQICKVAAWFEDKLRRDNIADCRRCVHNDGVTDIGITRCGLTGHPLCYQYKNNNMILNPCERQHDSHR